MTNVAHEVDGLRNDPRFLIINYFMYSVSTPILGPNRTWLRIAMKRRSSEKRYPATG